jgi:hypothetical protein
MTTRSVQLQLELPLIAQIIMGWLEREQREDLEQLKLVQKSAVWYLTSESLFTWATLSNELIAVFVSGCSTEERQAPLHTPAQSRQSSCQGEAHSTECRRRGPRKSADEVQTYVEYDEGVEKHSARRLA